MTNEIQYFPEPVEAKAPREVNFAAYTSKVSPRAIVQATQNYLDERSDQ